MRIPRDGKGQGRMTPNELAALAMQAIASGTNMTIVRLRGKKPPRGFPRGELLCEDSNGRNVYSYDPLRVLAWLSANGLVEVSRAKG